MKHFSERGRTCVIASVTGLLSVTLPQVLLAAPSVLDPNIGCDFGTGKLSSACIPMFIGHLVQIIFGGIGMFFILNVMFAGYQLAYGSVTGDKGAGKDRLQWSIIGLIVSICIFLILDLVLTVLLG